MIPKPRLVLVILTSSGPVSLTISLSTVGNLGHVIADPAFVQADHAAACGRDDVPVVAPP